MVIKLIFIILVEGLVRSNYLMTAVSSGPLPLHLPEHHITLNNMEIWKDIKDYKGYYQVSDKGRVRSLERTVNGKGDGRGSNYRRVIKGKHLKQRLNNSGYWKLSLGLDGVLTSYFVHRLVAEAFHPNPDNLPCVNHKNGIKTDNRPINIEWCTYSENQLHSYKMGLSVVKIGQDHHCAKMTDSNVRKLRRLRKAGMPLKKLSLIFNISQSKVSDIANRKRWTHIK